jgi:hypothetical protein
LASVEVARRSASSAATVHDMPVLSVPSGQALGQPGRQPGRRRGRVPDARVQAVPPHGQPGQPVGGADGQRRHPAQHGRRVGQPVVPTTAEVASAARRAGLGWPGATTSPAERRQ